MDENQIEEWTRTMRRASEEIDRLRAENAAIEAENEALQKRVAELEESVLRELTAESQRLGLYDMEKSC